MTPFCFDFDDFGLSARVDINLPFPFFLVLLLEEEPKPPPLPLPNPLLACLDMREGFECIFHDVVFSETGWIKNASALTITKRTNKVTPTMELLLIVGVDLSIDTNRRALPVVCNS